MKPAEPLPDKANERTLMIGFSSHIGLCRPGILARFGVAVAVALVAFQCLAEDAKTEPPAAAGEPHANEPFRPGLIEAFGRLLEDSAAKLNSQLNHAHDTLGEIGNQTGDAAKGAIDGAKSTADTLIGLPSARIVTSRQVCTAAANGAPDCRAAADTMCRAKGFASGKTLDTQTTQKCPAWVWLTGRPPADGDCARETSVTRAVCQ
jgi:hypothetical protein